MNNDQIDQSSVAQGDVAVNIFMIFLSILAVLTLSTAVVSEVGFRRAIQSETVAESPLVLVPGWAPVHPVRLRLAVRTDGLTLITFDQPARRIAGLAEHTDETRFDGSRLLRSDPDPLAHIVQLSIDDTAIPSEMVIWHIPFDQLPGDGSWPEPWEDFANQAPEIDVLVYPGAEQLAWDVATSLQQGGVAFALRFQRREWIAFQRRTELFSFEDVYR